MESIIYNKIFGTMFVDIMLENHAWHRYWDGFHVSHNEPAITWCNVHRLFILWTPFEQYFINFYVHMVQRPSGQLLPRY